jgi:hypothetical protein
MLAEFAVGHRDAAEILYLVAAVLAALAAWNEWPERRAGPTIGWLAVCALAVGWILL